MDIKDLHNKFLECNSGIDIDSRSIRYGSMFFAIKGDNFDGNEFVEEALNKGAKYAIVDSDSVNIDNKVPYFPCCRWVSLLPAFYKHLLVSFLMNSFEIHMHTNYSTNFDSRM